MGNDANEPQPVTGALCASLGHSASNFLDDLLSAPVLPPVNVFHICWLLDGRSLLPVNAMMHGCFIR